MQIHVESFSIPIVSIFLAKNFYFFNQFKRNHKYAMLYMKILVFSIHN